MIKKITLILMLCFAALSTQAQPFCDQAQAGAGFASDPACQTVICAADSWCCTNQWDSICAGAAATNPSCANCLSTAGGGGGPFCDQAQAGPGFPSDPACQTVICAADSWCCTNQWDSICAGAAATNPSCANCLSTAGGGGPYCDQAQPFPTPGFPSDPTCQAAICAADSYCCNTSWDGLCASAAAINPACTSCLAPPPPPVSNDECVNALPLICGQTVTGTTAGTSNVGNGPLCVTAASTAGGVWYTFVGTGQVVQATTCIGTSYDSKLFVYTGSCGAFTCVTGNDDACGLQSTVSFASIPGTTYYITLTLSCIDPVGNDLCTTAIPITCGATVTGTTIGATNAGNGPLCTTAASTAGAVWYTFTANNQAVTLSLCTGTTYDSKLFVYTGSCGAFTCVIGDDDGCGGIGPSTVSFAALNGVTYYVMVAGFGSATGNFTLTATCTDLPPPVTNDECATAINLPVPSCATYSTVGASDSPDSGPQCFDNEFGASYYFGGDVWFTFVMPASGWVTISIDNITFFAFIGGTPIAPLGLEIYSGTCADFGGGPVGPFCNQAQPGPGFASDPACQASICAADPFCCNTQWDGICAGAAATNPACVNCLSTSAPATNAEQCEILWDNTADEMLFQGTPGQTYIVRAWDLFDPFEQEAFDLCIEETQPTILSCNDTFTDSGGAAGNYVDLERRWYIICGENPGDLVEVTFNTFQIENNFDFMTVYDSFGPSATPLAGPATGSDWQGSTFTASNPSGCLTFFFTSDFIISDIGWEADVRCLCTQVISTPSTYTDFLCDGEAPDFAAAQASIGYQDNQGNPADGSVFTIKWFLNPTYTVPAPPDYTATYTGSGCAPQSVILWARATCTTGEFFDAGFMTLVIYPTPEAPVLVLTSTGTICTYAYAPATCPATSFSPAIPSNEVLGTPESTVTVTSTNGGCSVTYQIEKPACDVCYIPSDITGSACEGLVADFEDFEGSLDTGGMPGLGDVYWYYDSDYTQPVDENAPLNLTATGCTPSTYTLYAMGTCATGTLQPAGTLTLTFYAAPQVPTINVNDFVCTYSYSTPECPYISYLTPLTNEDPGDGDYNLAVDIAVNGCTYTYDVLKPLCIGCDMEASFTLVYEAGTSTSSFFNFGYITLTGSFTMPLTYAWDITPYVTYGVPTPGTINVLYTDDAIFTVTITDAVGCETVYSNLPTSINDLSIVSSLITVDNGTSTGAVNITVAGGTPPYTYTWEGPLGYSATTEDISGLQTGWYIVYITSTDGQSAYGWFWVPKESRGRGKAGEMSSITAYPNPFVGQTNIAFSVAETTGATVTLHGVNGQQTRELYNGIANAGETINIALEANDLPAGIYIARLTTANGDVQNYKLILGQ